MAASDPIPLLGATLRWPDGVVERDGSRIALSERERVVFGALIAAEGEPVTREALARVLGSDARQRSVDFAVRRLRLKVEPDPSAPRHVLTVHGAGYRFVPERQEVAPVRLTCRRWSLGDGWVDVDAGLVVRNGSRDRLSAQELDVFQRLVAATPEPVDRATLARDVWGRRATSALRYVDRVVHRLRAKLEPNPSQPTVIVTLPRVGLVLRSTTDSAPPSRRPLPAPVTPFVGRADERETLIATLASDARVITLTGVGGVGKTRLALEVASEWQPRAAFAELAEARSEEGMLSAVAEALSVPLQDDPVTQLGHVLASAGQLLLVLDTAEHLVEPLAELVDRWVRRAPQLRVLATSRERLGVPGERIVAVSPLSVDDAVALFAYHAVAARPDFRLTAATRPIVEALVDRLDRLPLALELVAPRLRTFGVQTLSEQVHEGLDVEASRGRPSRHATLTAALAWGWRLLSSSEQRTLVQLTAFEGGFDLEGALAVVDLGTEDVLDVLQGLVDKSWLHLVGDDRLRMLRTTRAYVIRQVDRASREGAERRHGSFVAALGRPERIAELDGPDGAQIIARYAQSLDDVVVAIPRALARGDHAVALSALEAAWATSRLRGPLTLVRRLLAAFETVDLDDEAERQRALVEARWLSNTGSGSEAKARFEGLRQGATAEVADRIGRELGWLLGLEGQLESALAELERAVAGARARNDPALEAACLASSAMVHQRRADLHGARDVTLAALAAYRRAGSRRGEGAVLSNLGLIAMRQGRFDEARTHFLAALEACREVDNRYDEAVAMANLGLLDMETGRLDGARRTYGRALELARHVGHRLLEGNLLANLANLELRQDALDLAELYAREALEVHRETRHRSGEGLTLALLGKVEAAHGRLDEALQRYDESLVVLADANDQPSRGTVVVLRGRVMAQRGDLAAARQDFEAAATLLQGHPPQLALGLARWAEALFEAGEGQEAVVLLQRANDLEPPEQSDAAELIAQLMARRLGS